MRLPVSATRQSTAERGQPILDPDEFLAGTSGAGSPDLGFLYFPPIVVIGRHDSALAQQSLQAFGAHPVVAAPGRHRRSNLFRDFVAASYKNRSLHKQQNAEETVAPEV